MNGRIDLAQAEAVGDMIVAQNQAQLDMAFKQMRGGLSSEIQVLREQLLTFIALVELELDFGEEDVEFADRSSLLNQIDAIQSHIQPLMDSFKYGNAIKQGIPVAIIGRPNAGKSSLLNLLLQEDRAIVSDIAGTTRDTIEEAIHIEGVAYRFIDTAGIRTTTDSIEQIGIEKALQKMASAEVVLYIFDVTQLSADDLASDLNVIREKNPNDRREQLIKLTALAKINIPVIKEAIKKLNERAFNDICQSNKQLFNEILNKIQENLVDTSLELRSNTQSLIKNYN